MIIYIYSRPKWFADYNKVLLKNIIEPYGTSLREHSFRTIRIGCRGSKLKLTSMQLVWTVDVDLAGPHSLNELLTYVQEMTSTQF